MSRALICELVHTFTTYFTLLTTLSLEFGHMGMNHCFLDHSLPKFNNLKVLVLKVVGMTDESQLGITPLIEASPYLQKLHIELEWCETTIFKNRIIRKKCPHQHLKEVKYSGYLGGFADRILTTYLTKNSVALETFIIVPLEYDAQEARGRARRQLQGKILKRVKLVIF
uniref:FBD domain-containing protein n=2 Tax=Solanum tuberosum TaxID=4113 RepID=M1BAN2_SOLTU